MKFKILFNFEDIILMMQRKYHAHSTNKPIFFGINVQRIIAITNFMIRLF